MAFFRSDKETSRVVLLLVVTQCLAILCGLTIFPHGYQYIQGSISHKLISWDGARYLEIGEQGYSWNAAFCIKHYCNIAFFPVQGLLDKAILFVFLPVFGANTAQLFIVFLSWLLGLASIFLFARLARFVMGHGAKNAIFLFAFYPGSVFILMGYPVGLIMILSILAVHYALQNLWWRAALCIGIGTATSAVMVFVGFAIGIYYLFYQLKKDKLYFSLIKISAWAVLALSGLLLFMLYQYYKFGTFTAFIVAQQAWGDVPDFAVKMQRLLTPAWYLGYYHTVLTWVAMASHHPVDSRGVGGFELQGQILHISDFIELEIQSLFNLLFLAITISGTILSWFFCIDKRAKYLLCSLGACVVFGYLWFQGAAGTNMQSTIRLIFPALSMFIGWGGLSNKFKTLEYWLFPLFVVFTFSCVVYEVSGYILI